MADKQLESAYYFRFVLEVIALVFIGWYGSTLATGWLSFFIAAALVLSTMLVWGIFNVPGDPSRSGKAPVVVPGSIRLAIEGAIFLLATYAVLIVAGKWWSILFICSVITHYVHTKKRIVWLIKQ